jgi:hypothetical protein
MKRLGRRVGGFLAVGGVLLARGAAAETPAYPAFETVNYEPQLTTAGPTNFNVYWGVWRTLTAAEREVLRRERGSRLFSNRRISWRTVRCDDGSLVNADSEDVWYLDPIRFDAAGKIEPIPEARRPDYLYFSLINMNGMKLVGPKGITIKGLRGEIDLDARFFLFAGSQAPSAAGFLDLRAFEKSQDPLNQAFFAKAHPYRWPVFYDERAHKEHSLQPPTDFAAQEPRALSRDHLRMKLVWESCDGSSIGMEGLVPGGVLPVGGPNRPGREDRGTGMLPIGVLKD